MVNNNSLIQHEKAREKQREEAISRIKLAGIHDIVLKFFTEDNILELSQQDGSTRWLSKEEKKMISDWEKESGSMVYHVIFGNYPFGECYNLLYVSRFENSWEYERELLENKQPVAYVINITNENCSEYGTIGIKSHHGGLIRTW